MEVLEAPLALNVAQGIASNDGVRVMLSEATLDKDWLTDMQLNFSVVARLIYRLVGVLAGRASSHRIHRAASRLAWLLVAKAGEREGY